MKTSKIFIIVIAISLIFISCSSPKSFVPALKELTCFPYCPQFFGTAAQILDMNGYKITYRNDSTNYMEARKDYSVLNKPVIATIVFKFVESRKKTERNKVKAYIYLNDYSGNKDFAIDADLNFDNPQSVVADEINRMLVGISTELNKNAFPD